jgi:Flp pilus assembly protein TadB
MGTTYNCPHCGSDNTEAAHLAVAKGTSKSDTTFVMVDGSDFGLHFGGAGTFTQSQLAERLDPGPKPGSGFLLFFLMLLICGVAFFYCLGANSWVGYGTGTILALTLLTAFGWSRGRKRVKAYPERLARFLRTWLCNRCGVVWEAS